MTIFLNFYFILLKVQIEPPLYSLKAKKLFQFFIAH